MRFIPLVLITFSIIIQYSYFFNIGSASHNVALESIPFSVGNWQGDEDRFKGDNVYELIGADETVLRHYRYNGNIITVYIGYYPEVREGKRPHSITGCYTGQGWNIQNSDIQSITTGEGTSPYRIGRLLISQGDDKQVAYYWLQNKRDVFISGFQTNIRLFLNKISFQRGDIAFIRITSYVRGNIEDTDKMMIEFITKLKPNIDKILMK